VLDIESFSQFSSDSIASESLIRRPKPKQKKRTTRSRVSEVKLPAYSSETDYFKEYWKLYLLNENLTNELAIAAKQNYKEIKKIYNLEDYYEHSLIP
jgi:hypothetical protein